MGASIAKASTAGSTACAGALVDAALPQALRTIIPNNTNKTNTLKRVFIFFSFGNFIWRCRIDEGKYGMFPEKKRP
jgi:hypothetical protein